MAFSHVFIPAALVPGAVDGLENTFALLLVGDPFAFILVIIGPSECAFALPLIGDPLSVVDVAAFVVHCALTMLGSLFELTFILVSVGHDCFSKPLHFVVLPPAVVFEPVEVEAPTLAVPLILIPVALIGVSGRFDEAAMPKPHVVFPPAIVD